MTVLPLLAVSFIMKIVAVLFVICCIALILIILVQKGRGGGLSGAFGGSMASGLLGSKTGDFLTWVTIVLVGIFLALAVVMAKYYKENISDFGEPEPPPMSQTTDQPPTPPIEDIDVETGDAFESSPVEDSVEIQLEPPVTEEEKIPIDNTEPAQDNTEIGVDTNVPNG